MAAPDARGVLQDTCFIDVKDLPYVLTTIDVSPCKNKEALVEKIRLYKTEARDVLYRYFLPDVAAQDSTMDSFELLASQAELLVKNTQVTVAGFRDIKMTFEDLPDKLARAIVEEQVQYDNTPNRMSIRQQVCSQPSLAGRERPRPRDVAGPWQED